MTSAKKHATAPAAAPSEPQGKEKSKGGKHAEQGFWITIKHGDNVGRHVFLKGVRGHETRGQRLANDAKLKSRHGVQPGHPAHEHVQAQRALPGPGHMKALPAPAKHAGLKPSTRAMLESRKPVNAGGQRRDNLMSSRTVNALRREPMSGGRHGYEVSSHGRDLADKGAKERSAKAASIRAARKGPATPEEARKARYDRVIKKVQGDHGVYHSKATESMPVIHATNRTPEGGVVDRTDLARRRKGVADVLRSSRAKRPVEATEAPVRPAKGQGEFGFTKPSPSLREQAAAHRASRGLDEYARDARADKLRFSRGTLTKQTVRDQADAHRLARGLDEYARDERAAKLRFSRGKPTPATTGSPLREQAAAHRASKGIPDRSERAKELKRKLKLVHETAHPMAVQSLQKARGKSGQPSTYLARSFSKQYEAGHAAANPGGPTLRQQAAAHRQFRGLDAAKRQARAEKLRFSRGKPTPTATSHPADSQTFAARVHATLPTVGKEGRFGEGKVFISHAHAAYEKAHGKIPIEDFKRRLGQASNERHLDLSPADLAPHMHQPSVKASRMERMGAEYHFVREAEKSSPKASLREMAAAHRAGKGTTLDRVKRLQERFAKEQVEIASKIPRGKNPYSLGLGHPTLNRYREAEKRVAYWSRARSYLEKTGNTSFLGKLKKSRSNFSGSQY